MKKFLLAPTAAVAMTAHCQAADIRFIPPSDSYSPAIIITGTFESGDFAKFSAYADKISAGNKVFVTLHSNGGRVAEGAEHRGSHCAPRLCYRRKPQVPLGLRANVARWCTACSIPQYPYRLPCCVPLL